MFTEDYAYLSSYSVSWLEHARNYVDMAVERFGLGQKSLVTEVAANDGYLLQYVRDKQIPCFGIEPTHVAAEAAREKGIDILEDFFGVRLAEDLKRNGRQADLMVGNNVLAHVPDINDFVKGFTILLKPDGVVTFEFPHLLNLIKYTLFDTIYHEHFSYLSLHAVRSVFRSNGLSLFDVEEVKTHGGSYRVYGQRADTGIHPVSENVERFLQAEKEAGLLDKQVYLDFSSKLQHIKNDLLSFLIEQNNRHMKVAAYGAAAKGNTLMNFAGVRKDYVSYVVDKNPTKSGKYMPGNHIPIVDENLLLRDKPDYILILPWNLKDEIIQQLDYTRSWGCRFVSAIPELNVLA
jgi:SAM-dependent methyltransferase